jgi:hypothetical protein
MCGISAAPREREADHEVSVAGQRSRGSLNMSGDLEYSTTEFLYYRIIPRDANHHDGR